MGANTVQGPMERPIIFNAAMVRAILEDRKTQTRRIVKPQPEHAVAMTERDGKWYRWLESEKHLDPHNIPSWRCPYGSVGDRLWVKETHWRHGHWVKNGLTKTGRQKWRFVPTAGQPVHYLEEQWEKYTAPKDRTERAWYKRPSIFMPRWASRITLEITKVRVERLQEISEDDAKAEGVNAITVAEIHRQATWNDRQDFAQVWNHINGKGAWEKNPWIWVLEFRGITPSDPKVTKSEHVTGVSREAETKSLEEKDAR